MNVALSECPQQHQLTIEWVFFHAESIVALNTDVELFRKQFSLPPLLKLMRKLLIRVIPSALLIQLRTLISSTKSLIVAEAVFHFERCLRTDVHGFVVCLQLFNLGFFTIFLTRFCFAFTVIVWVRWSEEKPWVRCVFYWFLQQMQLRSTSA